MHKQTVWTLVAAALGICSGQNFQEGNVCYYEPDLGRGRDIIKGWTYDAYLDKCYVFHHAKRSHYGNENIFQSESLCNQRCRPTVPAKCYAKPPPSKGKSDLPVVTYDPNNGRCLDIRATKQGGAENVFNNRASCKKQCLDADLRLCLNATKADCEYIGDPSYRYNAETETCEAAPAGTCGGFQSAEKCFQRCGILVENKCTLPIQNITTCENPTKRYGYNKEKDQCEELFGCADGGNSFQGAKECWSVCAPKHRCNMSPDTGRFAKLGLYTRYYFDVTTNECTSARKLKRTVPGNTNLFVTADECKQICKPQYQGTPEH
uniref:Putative secreted protein n=1 Tax=Ixodes scapularis TaxID=6945 RepID=Q8MVC6_IXOSC|nr:putative secreted protein [Ixodes scapularis]